MARLNRYLRRTRKLQQATQRTLPSVATKYGRRRPDLVGELFCSFKLNDELEDYVMGNLNRFASAGNFLKKEDAPQPIQLIIARTGEHRFEGKLPQLVLYWQQPGIKPLLCNATNVKLLMTLFGAQAEEQLIGKTIEVYTDPTVMMHGQVVGGLRVRLPSGPPVQSPPPASYPPAPQTPAAPAQPMSYPPPQVAPPQGNPFPDAPW
jgi:hypothetical protein